jgi:type VI secretion system protein ImpK
VSFFHILENRAEPLLHQFAVSSFANGRESE